MTFYLFLFCCATGIPSIYLSSLFPLPFTWVGCDAYNPSIHLHISLAYVQSYSEHRHRHLLIFLFVHYGDSSSKTFVSIHTLQNSSTAHKSKFLSLPSSPVRTSCPKHDIHCICPSVSESTSYPKNFNHTSMDHLHHPIVCHMSS